MSTIETTEIVGSEIHPEIPMPAWAVERYLDDDGRIFVDTHRYDDGKFDVTLDSTKTIRTDDVLTSDDNAYIQWRSVWADGTGVDSETFTVLAADIPELIAVLQRAHAEIVKA
jgi:hypothetical protein